jgi:hypothetical protein
MIENILFHGCGFQPFFVLLARSYNTYCSAIVVVGARVKGPENERSAQAISLSSSLFLEKLVAK